MKSVKNYLWIVLLIVLVGYFYFNRDENKINTPVELAVTDKPIWGDGTVRKITEKEFNELIADFDNPYSYKGYGPAIVDIYASWCGPCKAVSKIIDVLAEATKGKWQFYKIDYDSSPTLDKTYKVNAVPFILLCKGSEVKYIEPEEITDEMEKLDKELNYSPYYKK